MSVSASESVLLPTQRTSTRQRYDALYSDGIVGFAAAMPREWAQQLRADYEPLMHEALSYPEGTVPRGYNRYYHVVHPERLSGFAQLLAQPDIDALLTEALGDDYQVVEVGFDIALPGSRHQPWHRDFRMTSDTAIGRWLSVLALNVTTVDITEGLAPFEIAPGTQWDDGLNFEHGMFPREEAYGRYDSLAVRKYPKLGDVSCRTPLALHRGTTNHTDIPRPVLIVGICASVIRPSPAQQLFMTPDYLSTLPDETQRHLEHVAVVDELPRLRQTHDIEGLRMGGA